MPSSRFLVMSSPAVRIVMLSVSLLAALWLAAASPASAADFTARTGEDDILRRIGVDEKLGARVPLDLAFTDQDGRAVRLGDYFTGRPVVLTLNFYECPMLCPITFRSLAATMGEMKGLTPGKDYRVVTVSFNPDETREKAEEKARESHSMLKGAEEMGRGWPFLFGKEDSIRALTGTVGFRYVKLGPGNFAHPTVFIVLTPEGRVSRYLYGVKQDQMDLRLALTEAAGGEIGASKTLNKVLLFCYHYDPVGRKYSLAAMNIMKAAGALTLALLLALFVLLRKKDA